MKRRWQLQHAKNKLSEVVERARAEGPQTITKRGTDAAVVLSVEDYRDLTEKETTLVEFLQQSPLRGVELDLRRTKDLPRDVDL